MRFREAFTHTLTVCAGQLLSNAVHHSYSSILAYSSMVLAVLRPVLCHARVCLEAESEERKSMQSKLQSAQEAVQAGRSGLPFHR